MAQHARSRKIHCQVEKIIGTRQRVDMRSRHMTKPNLPAGQL